MLPSPSIWPPDRKNTSMRPWPAQSNSSRAPSVKKVWSRLPSSETYGLPPPRSRANSAAVAGIGDAAPTATWRTSPISRQITSASNSSSRKVFSGGTPLMHVPLQVVGKPFGRRGEPGVFGHMRGVDAVMIGQWQRPGAARLDRNRLDIEAGQRAGGEQRIAQQIAVVKFLHGDDGLLRGMRHGNELALDADKDIAGAIGHGRVEQDDVGLERRQQHDRIVVAERIVENFPVRAVGAE